jgi:hypothetical protein
MGEIIDFSVWLNRYGKHHGSDGLQMNDDSSRPGREEAARQYRAVIAARVESAKMDNETRAVVARNLHQLIQEAKAEGIAPSDLVPTGEPGFSSSGSDASTKLLWWYTLKPPVQGETGISKLRRKTDGYVRIARKIAEKRGQTEDYYLPRLFEGTHYAGEASESERRRAPAHIDRFRSDLAEMVSGIGIQHNLSAYFERLWEEQVPADRMDAEKHWIGPSRIFPYSVFLTPDYMTCMFAGEIAGLPSIRLYREPFGEKIPVRLFISRAPIATTADIDGRLKSHGGGPSKLPSLYGVMSACRFVQYWAVIFRSRSSRFGKPSSCRPKQTSSICATSLSVSKTGTSSRYSQESQFYSGASKTDVISRIA